MMQYIMINYRSIFKYEDHKEVITYQEKGNLTTNSNHKIIDFTNNNTNIQIIINGEEVVLKHGKASLKLVKDQLVKNNYYTEYGEVELKTKLTLLEYSNNIKIKYDLIEHNVLISEVYILINIKVLEN